MGHGVTPMLAAAGALPVGPGWAYELDWGGTRALVDVGPEVTGGLSVTGVRGEDLTGAYPELAGLADVVCDGLLDGELVVFAGDRPVPGRRRGRATPATFLAFDVIRLYGVDLRARPYRDRRATLERLGLDSPCVTVPPAFDDGEATVAAAREFGLGGVVAKRLDSPYRAGTRSAEWVRVRFTEEREFVVCGWRWGRGERAGALGGLVLGYYDRMRLRPAGRVDAGFDTAAQRDLVVRLAPLRRDTPPFDGAPGTALRPDVVWCEPKLVARVAFTGWNPPGEVRDAEYRGLCPGAEPREVGGG